MIMDMVFLSALVVLAVNLVLTVRIAFWPKAAGAATDLNPVLDRLQVIKGDVERLDRVVREDGEQARTGADERGRLLRDEVTKALSESRAEMSQAMSAIRGEIVAALNKASLELRESSNELSKAQKERLDDVGAKLTGMTHTLETRLEANRNTIESRLTALQAESVETAIKLRGEMQQSLAKMGEGLREGAKESSETLRLSLETMVGKIDRLSETNSQALDKLRESLQTNLTTLRNENSEKLEQMRVTVDEKLQGTLEKRLGESFKQVSERLDAVHNGLGEMKTLATGVGDLKKVLTNVKSRGTWGETQISNLLAQVFSPEQYLVNAPTRPGSSERVEFAIRIPGRGPEDMEQLLPIDAKFPMADYERLVEASERIDVEAVEVAAKALEDKIKVAARAIRDKYINPPHTTDIAILFLPTEGLYSEILRRRGLADLLQNDFRVIIAGPTNLLALVNIIQAGYQRQAIERRSGEVWEILGKAKTEFNKYGGVLDKVKKKLEEATKSVDDVNVRHRAVTRSLTLVAEPEQVQAQVLLGAPSVTEISGSEEVD